MSVRQEDGPKNSSSSRGLGLAAAAIGVGVGVGAALYCFFGKRPENPDSAGSTSHWEIEHPDAFNMDSSGTSCNCYDSDDCVTISEHTTTDTSIISTASDASSNNDMSDSDGASDSNGFDDNESDSDSYYRDEYVSEYSSNTESSYNTSGSYSEVDEIGYLTDSGSDGDADNSDWEEMTSDDLPRRFSYVRPNVFPGLNRFTDLIGSLRHRLRRPVEESIRKSRRNKAFRERSWTLEECTICYEVILKNQEVMSLPCTHNFHSACIMPWLQQRQTCPNCRTSVN